MSERIFARYFMLEDKDAGVSVLLQEGATHCGTVDHGKCEWCREHDLPNHAVRSLDRAWLSISLGAHGGQRLCKCGQGKSHRFSRLEWLGLASLDSMCRVRFMSLICDKRLFSWLELPNRPLEPPSDRRCTAAAPAPAVPQICSACPSARNAAS